MTQYPNRATDGRVVRWRGVFALVLLGMAYGCTPRDYSEYVEPPDANAQLVVHPDYGDTFDVFLDGKRLGRISWTQAYRISAGQHVFRAKEARRFTSQGMSAEYLFTIAPGRTLHLAVVKWGQYGAADVAGTEQLEAAGIRISEIQP